MSLFGIDHHHSALSKMPIDAHEGDESLIPSPVAEREALLPAVTEETQPRKLFPLLLIWKLRMKHGLDRLWSQQTMRLPTQRLEKLHPDFGEVGGCRPQPGGCHLRVHAPFSGQWNPLPRMGRGRLGCPSLGERLFIRAVGHPERIEHESPHDLGK